LPFSLQKGLLSGLLQEADRVILIDGKFSVDKKIQLDVTFVFFISLVIVAQHVSGNHVPNHQELTTA